MKRKTKLSLFQFNYKGQYHPNIKHRRKFNGKWFQHFHPNITYEGGTSKSSAVRMARELRAHGYNARIVRTRYGYVVYHRRK